MLDLINTELDFTEMNKLEEYLKDNGYAYNRKTYFGGYILNVYDCAGNYLWDAIIHNGSYGRNEGLLEISGCIVEVDYDSVEGYLSADDIIKRLEKN